jgi:hypothetical protein
MTEKKQISIRTGINFCLKHKMNSVARVVAMLLLLGWQPAVRHIYTAIILSDNYGWPLPLGFIVLT